MNHELLSIFEIEYCKKQFTQKEFPEFQRYLETKFNEWKTQSFHIAVTGNSGTGKSSFINTIRGLTGDDEGAAQVGVTKTTTEPTPYPHPNNEKLKFWDLPGVGTTDFLKDGYLKTIDFDKYDFFLIISNNRVTENDIWLAKEIIKKKKQFFFIRTRIHTSINNPRKTNHKKDENVLLTEMRENIKKNLKKLYKKENLFLIDSHHHEMYDFNKLKQRIIEGFPRDKNKTLILSIGYLIKVVIIQKAKNIRDEIEKTLRSSTATKTVSIPGVYAELDIKFILRQSEWYFKQFGLDEECLFKTANIIECNIDLLRFVIKRCKEKYLTTKGIKQFIERILTVSVFQRLKGWALCLPVFGSRIASRISFYTMRVILEEMLTKIEERALQVVDTAVKNSSHM